jgi:hypothetical protein
VSPANDALTKAVADHGLLVDEYSSILQNNPEVRGKLLQRIRPPQYDPNSLIVARASPHLCDAARIASRRHARLMGPQTKISCIQTQFCASLVASLD